MSHDCSGSTLTKIRMSPLNKYAGYRYNLRIFLHYKARIQPFQLPFCVHLWNIHWGIKEMKGSVKGVGGVTAHVLPSGGRARRKGWSQDNTLEKSRLSPTQSCWRSYGMYQCNWASASQYSFILFNVTCAAGLMSHYTCVWNTRQISLVDLNECALSK